MSSSNNVQKWQKQCFFIVILGKGRKAKYIWYNIYKKKEKRSLKKGKKYNNFICKDR